MKIHLILLACLILATTLLVVTYGRMTVRPIPQCNEDWPQSYSNLVIQPCPTPMVE